MYIMNKEERRIYMKKYMKRNREKRRMYMKDYQEKNKEKLKNYYKKRYRNNIIRIKLNAKIYREENREKIRVRHKKYRNKNKEKYMKYYEENIGDLCCSTCGSEDDLVLHHIDPSTKIKQMSIISKFLLISEVKKCIILCRSCHTTIHNKKIY